MRTHPTGISFLLVFTLLSGATALLAQKKPELFVLSVGIEKYQDATINLKYAAADARDLAAMLKKQQLLWDVKEVKVLTDGKAKGNDIIQAMDGFRKKVTSDDYFVFIFSGHGIEGRLVPHDYDGNAYRSTLSKEEIMEHLDGLGCGYLLFIDACHSGSFAKSLPGKNIDVGGARKNDVEKATKDLVDALAGADKPYLVFGSSGTHQKSWECTSCGHGYFAQAVLWAFENKPVQDGSDTYSPDADQNGLLSVSELDNYLKEAVRVMTQAEGGPQKVYSRITMGKDVALTAWKNANNNNPVRASVPTDIGGKNLGPLVTQLCVQTNKTYQLGCKDNLLYIQCNGGFLGPADFKNKLLAPGSTTTAALDIYRGKLVDYTVKNPDAVLAVLRLNDNDDLILTTEGIHWAVARYEKMRWIKRREFVSYQTLTRFSFSADASYLNIRENGKKRVTRQLLLRHNDDIRGLKPAELQIFLEKIIVLSAHPTGSGG